MAGVTEALEVARVLASSRSLWEDVVEIRSGNFLALARALYAIGMRF
jgi:hypothetical protein